MFNRETSKSLAPRSWWTVALWIILVGVVATHPIESGRAAVSFVGSTSRWVGYTAFADCGDQPPLDWMAPKECPDDPAGTTDGGSDPAVEEPSAHGADGEAGYAVRVDGDGIRAVLEHGTDGVLALHREVTEIQQAGGLSLHIGDGAGS
jgi:hypothetical protein